MKFMFLFLGLFSLSLSAATQLPKEILFVQTHNGISKVHAYQYFNAWGRREVRLEATTLPLIDKLNPILGYGRDTDDDDKVDTWFMIDSEKGMVKYITGNDDTWGQRNLMKKVFRKYKSSKFAHVSAAYGAILGSLMSSISQAAEAEKSFWNEWMDLEEFHIRLFRAKADGMLTNEQHEDGLNVLISGYALTLESFEKIINQEYWILGGVDIALWTGGGIAIKWLGNSLALVGKKIAPEALGNMISKTATTIKNKFSRLKVLKGVSPNILAAIAFKSKFNSHFKALMFKSMLTRKVYHRLANTSISLTRATTEWKYITFMAGIQLTSETFANYKEVAHSDPIVMTQNILKHQSIMHNVSFMSRSAFLMTAATYGIHNKKARFMTCGFLALGHAGVTNLIFNTDENPDYLRMALDTGWEAGVGNAQVQLDLFALNYFEKLSVKKFNPQLKLLGWAVVLIEQAVGFTGYSMLTQSINEEDPSEASVHLIPVLVQD